MKLKCGFFIITGIFNEKLTIESMYKYEINKKGSKYDIKPCFLFVFLIYPNIFVKQVSETLICQLTLIMIYKGYFY